VFETTEFKGIGYPHVVRMSFELPYLDWCRFEKSDVFHQLVKYLEELEMPDVSQSCQEGSK